jgi:hypothetical protein
MTTNMKNILGRIFALSLAALVSTCGLTPALAQFASQTQWGGTAGGSANAQTITIANVGQLSDLLGVQIAFVPVAPNTSATTLAVSGLAATPIRKLGPSGPTNLTGSELTNLEPACARYDGTQFVLECRWLSTPTGTAFKNAKLVNSAAGTSCAAGGSTYPNCVLAYTADELVVEASGGVSHRLVTVSCQADITASGAGGLDTGSVAQNTGYFYWVIYNPATNTTNCMWSLASTIGSLTLPSGYTFVARVGYDYVENAVGKRISRIICYGRRCQFVVTPSSATTAMPTLQAGSTSNVWTSETAGVVPSTASAIIMSIFSNYGDGATACGVAPNGNYGVSSGGSWAAPDLPLGFSNGSGSSAQEKHSA